MRALILCAGAGSRLRPLTQIMPKPLVKVAGVPMIMRQLCALAKAGVKDFAVNAAAGADRLQGTLANDPIFGKRIHFSIEGDVAAGALETRGGIAKVLDWLTEEEDVFIVAAGDIVTDFDYARLVAAGRSLSSDGTLAHLVLVPNPVYHPAGDLALEPNGHLSLTGKKLTFASFGVYHKALFKDIPAERAPLFPWLYDFVRARRVTGERYDGRWANVGSIDELKRAEALFAERTITDDVEEAR